MSYTRTIASASTEDLEVGPGEHVLCEGALGRGVVHAGGELTVRGPVVGSLHVLAGGRVVCQGAIEGRLEVEEGGVVTVDSPPAAAALAEPGDGGAPGTVVTRPPGGARGRGSRIAGGGPRSPVVSTLRAALVVLALLAVLYLAYRLRQPLTWVGLALFLAVALSTPVGVLSRRIGRRFAIPVTYLLVILVPVLIAFVLVPPFVRQFTDLVSNAPAFAAEVRTYVEGNERLRELDQQYNLAGRLQQQAGGLPARIGNAALTLGNLGAALLSSLFAAFTILVLSLFFQTNGRSWTRGLLALTGPPDRAHHLEAVLDRMRQAVGHYVVGALVQATVAGVLAYIVLVLIGVPFAAPLAVLVGLFDLVPLVGATIASALVAVVTLFYDFPTATILWVIFAVIYQQFENYVVQPQIQKRAVDIQPFVVLVSVLFGSSLFGVLGALLAIPVAAALQIAVREWWSARQSPSDATVEG